jgi:very-short-patch-repair endonuclease
LICQNYFQDKSTNFIQANAYESEFGLAIVDTQVRIGKYRVDFLIREHHLIVEYDEERHARPICREKDRRRERALIALGYKIIRVKKKESIGKALNKILNVLWDNKSNTGIETNAKVVRSAHD